ncbi:MAG: nitroreductase family protein [Bacteroidota bacterium]|nr:nitroreductase family protein [Bacteroidota bacterium]MDP4225272.1 nitroreductase family protein [Bacteroidota bacterium]MDP4273043.1 nitroreductase family protein [Bacteroidota bacterium]
MHHPLLNELFSKRRSLRALSDLPIEADKLISIFESARWAPSANNQQPWRFIYAQRENKADFERLFNCLLPGNQVWVKNASVLLVTVAEVISSYNQKNNPYAWHDTGLATENLILQATHLGLIAHPMAGFDKDKARKDLHIPPSFEPVAMVAVGYPGDINELPPELQEKERGMRVRRPINDLFFKGRFE